MAHMNSPKRLFVFICCLLLSVVGLTERLTAQTAATARAAHPLWKIQGKTSAVYLLGSIHFCKSDFYPLARPIEEAYERSKVVVFEIDLDRAGSAESQSRFLTAGMYPAGEKISQYLSGETYAALQAKVRTVAGQPTAFDQFRPWLAAVSLVAIELQKLGFDPNQGIDKHFFKKAQSAKKQIMPLETVEAQISLFTELSKEDQELLLKSTLKDIGRFPEIFAEVIQSWQKGDVKKLENLLLEIMKEYPALYKKFLTDRNRDWVSKVEKLVHEGKDAFVVVGMAHLVGADSLIDLLKSKGLRVEQL